MRVVLAGFSAMLALLIVWRAHSGDSDDKKSKMANVGKNKTWLALILDFFTGKYLWDVYQSSKRQDPPPEEQQQSTGTDTLRHSLKLIS